MSKIVKGRFTLPTELNFIDETKELLEKWGADAIRDSDGTDLDDELLNLGAINYTKYFVARGDNEFALSHLDEVQQLFVQSNYHTAKDKSLTGAYLLSADTSGDGKVTILDLLQVQKHILGDKKL